MKKQTILRPLVSVSLLLSGLVLLSGCFNGKNNQSDCVGCGSASHNMQQSGDVLLTINGKPAITTSSYQEYWNDVLASQPQLAQMVPFMPNIEEEVYKDLENNMLIKAWVSAEKIDQSPEYLKKRQKQHDLLDRVLAQQAFEEAIVNSIDTSDAALMNFYEENKNSNAMLQQPPFVKVAGGVKAQAVEFSDEKKAKDFLNKVQKAGADFAKEAKAIKADVKDLGVVSAQSRNVDPFVKAKVMEMQPNTVELVQSGKQFSVVKALSKQEAEYAPFEEIKDSVKQAKIQTDGMKVLTNKLETLKKEYNVQGEAAKNYFAQKKEKQQAELQEKIKAIQAEQAAKPDNESEAPAEAQPMAMPAQQSV